MDLFAVKITEYVSNELYKDVLSKISHEKQARIKKFLHHNDAVRGITAEVLTSVILSRVLNRKIWDIKIHFNDYGKPYLEDYPSIFYNISHSGDWVVLAIDDMPVGIDIEEIRQIDLRIAERFFSVDEVHELNGKTEDKKLDYFYAIWTLKESYIKAEGKGLSIPLNSFSIVDINDSFILDNISDSPMYYLKQYHLDERYKLAVCARSREFSLQINLVNQIELFNEYLQLLYKKEK